MDSRDGAGAAGRRGRLAQRYAERAQLKFEARDGWGHIAIVIPAEAWTPTLTFQRAPSRASTAQPGPRLGAA
ncbi:hypothetical protein GCM10012319_15630 [Comamonas sp. KCTC 72670]|nr:hypothetical protein GCM10012319_15630 [Comamonas sp. KCTC 72670]